MINFNGELLQNSTVVSLNNRGYKYGDCLFETLKVVEGKILFWEDHYFRLMASMRILRMEIPMNFTMAFLENEIIKTIEANNFGNKASRIRLNVDRGEGGTYLPVENTVNYSILVEPLQSKTYDLNQNSYITDLFKDHYITPGLLSNLKTNAKQINTLASIFASENGLDNCLLLNSEKSVIEATQGNIFLVQGNKVKTPKLADGCLNGVMRKQIIEIIERMDDFEIEEVSISPFEIQKSDEIFITNVIKGVQPITNYRKKVFSIEVSRLLVNKLNDKLGLN